MPKRLLLLVSLLSTTAAADAATAKTVGEKILETAFDPRRNFQGDLPGADDELVLTAWASARDDYAPAYSLAIAYRCRATATAGPYQCGYTARMLGASAAGDEEFGRSIALVARAKAITQADQMRRALKEAALPWLEADVDACPNAIHAMDSVRVADWSPDIHYALQALEDRAVVMHPAAIRVTMSGSYTKSTYEGWRLADGVPGAVRDLTETLAPCWRPAASPPPWNRR